MLKPSHLTDEAANVLLGTPDERVYFIQSKRWIAYPKGVQILDQLSKMLKHPRTTRMPSLIVYGDSGMGKSIVRRHLGVRNRVQQNQLFRLSHDI
jgi:hypothetical protein